VNKQFKGACRSTWLRWKPRTSESHVLLRTLGWTALTVSHARSAGWCLNFRSAMRGWSWTSSPEFRSRTLGFEEEQGRLWRTRAMAFPVQRELRSRIGTHVSVVE
jgi:hypothetical protein